MKKRKKNNKKKYRKTISININQYQILFIFDNVIDDVICGIIIDDKLMLMVLLV